MTPQVVNSTSITSNTGADPRQPTWSGSLSSNIALLVRLRWIAIVAATLALLVSRAIGCIDSLLLPLVAIAGLATLNVVRQRRQDQTQAVEILEWNTFWDIHIDLLALAWLLHYSGGIENPLSILFLLHPAIAAIILTALRPLLVGLSAVLIYGALALAGFSGLLTNHALKLGSTTTDMPIDWQSGELVVARIPALALCVFTMIYLVQTLANRMRKSESQRRVQEHLTRSRDRLARIGEISAGLAHSIRNPLHGALNCLELIKSENADPQQVEALELLNEALQRIQTVTTRLLVLTRDAPIRPVEVNLADQVRDTLHFIEGRSKNAGVTIKASIVETSEIHVDPDHLHEALYNILDNAIAASNEQSTTEVTVSVHPFNSANPGYCIQIADQGAGIRPEDLSRIFDPFFTTKAIGDGSGLGLAIAKRVVEEHGGSIEVESSRGGGTTVRIFLPRHQLPVRRQEAS